MILFCIISRKLPTNMFKLYLAKQLTTLCPEDGEYIGPNILTEVPGPVTIVSCDNLSPIIFIIGPVRPSFSYCYTINSPYIGAPFFDIFNVNIVLTNPASHR